jgi:predicted esterase
MSHAHAGQPVATRGAPLPEARIAVVLLHGRGASADDILTLSDALDLGALPPTAFLAPQAARGSWYPYSFLAPIEHNQPYLNSALRMLEELLASIQRTSVSPERTVLIGFSQGGCLALEFAARNPRHYGALAGLSAGLIGPPATRWNGESALSGTPAFLGCSDVDPHIPLWRVRETEEALGRMGATVDTRIYPGAPHAVNADEVEALQALLEAIEPDPASAGGPVATDAGPA